jgi:AAA15 family ATPase/GTPase
VLQSLHIQNFRGISSLKVERLGRVNLLVGANNVGKTTALEALSLHAAPPLEAPAAAMELLARRQDLSRPGIDTLGMFRRLFYEGDSDKPIQIGQIGDSEDNLKLSTGWLQKERTDKEITFKTLLGSWASRPSSDVEPILRAEREGKSSHLVVQSREMAERRFRMQFTTERPSSSSLRLLYASGLEHGNMNRLWDRVAIQDREDEVLRALRLIEPDIERVLLVEDSNEAPFSSRLEPNHRLPFVRRRASGATVSRTEPLKNLGDGMTRLFELALCLVTAENGLFLLDEAESGLHYLVLDDLWRFVFTLAQSLNIQVFATTHSADCLSAFARAASESNEEGAVVRLWREAGGLYSTAYNEAELEIVAKHRLEIR